MPRPASAKESEAPPLTALARMLLDDGLAWAQAELAITRIEALAVARRALTSFLMCVAAGILGIAGVTVLAQAVVLLVADWIGNPATAGVLVGVALLLITAGLAYSALRAPRLARPVSALFRWLFDSGKTGRAT